MERSHFKQKGASLIELVIGLAVGGILIAAGVGLIQASLKASLQNRYLQAASFLGTELMAKVSAYAERKWVCVNNGPKTNPAVEGCGIYNLEKGTHHYVVEVGGEFRSHIGDESNLFVGEVPYTRYFYVYNVSRNGAGNIEAIYNSQNEDPSTQQVIVVVEWPGGGKIENVKYVTRNRNEVLHQTNWSGGVEDSISYPANSTPAVYGAKANIDVTVPGSIKIGS